MPDCVLPAQGLLCLASHKLPPSDCEVVLTFIDSVMFCLDGPFRFDWIWPMAHRSFCHDESNTLGLPGDWAERSAAGASAELGGVAPEGVGGKHRRGGALASNRGSNVGAQAVSSLGFQSVVAGGFP